ncbi:hypothetical protein NOK12_16910 [Nocardioides sp. OK12]|uniref:hypothetical protein n=1 Tax=Nocardioides sp. OK12 TaxID=2758661 RepID=UPI0021C3947A|nr:hypothetical protein [Nocardioides sp. OK12]GHJ59173.1 hypothetical protein NOK12_16910 [Nocardioides sp. OK12]
MTTYRATITFDLADGDAVDAATAATLFGERLFSEAPDFSVTSLSVTQESA